MTTKKRELTDRQKTFLEVLFDESSGDTVQAKLIAGYSEHSSTSSIDNCCLHIVINMLQAL